MVRRDHEDLEYFRRRAKEEQEKADAAPGSCRGTAHRIMAEEYAKRVRHGGSREAETPAL
jgi:hypothetical protein